MSPENADGVYKDDSRKPPPKNAKSSTWWHERVVRIPNETARWVFTNHTHTHTTPDDATPTPTQVNKNFALELAMLVK